MSDVEGRARAAAAAGDLGEAATILIDAYGSEVLGFLIGLSDDHELAREAFAEASQRLWQSMASFGWRASARTWFYAIARNCFYELLRDGFRQRRQAFTNLPSHASVLIARSRTETSPFLRTEVKGEIFALRQALSAEERELLILRVDRALDWSEVARILDGEASHDETRLSRYRKKFQRVKEKLRALAEERGLLDEH